MGITQSCRSVQLLCNRYSIRGALPASALRRWVGARPERSASTRQTPGPQRTSSSRTGEHAGRELSDLLLPRHIHARIVWEGGKQNNRRAATGPGPNPGTHAAPAATTYLCVDVLYKIRGSSVHLLLVAFAGCMKTHGGRSFHCDQGANMS